MQLWFVGEKEYRRARKKEKKKFQDWVMNLELKEYEYEQNDTEAKTKLCSDCSRDCRTE